MLLIFLSLSNRCQLNIDMKMIRSSNFSGSMFRSCRSSGESQMTRKSWDKSTRTQSVLRQFQIIHPKHWTVEILQLDFSIFGSLLNTLTFSPSTRRNLSRPALLLSSTQTPGRALVWISSMTELSNQSVIYSEFRLDGAISISA